MLKKRIYLSAAVVMVMSVLFAVQSYTHCQIPCGIYSDETRFALLEEHIATIEKSMKQIEEIMDAEEPNTNQAVRWVNNKEQHADEFTHILTYYFLAQRIKPVDGNGKDAYLKKLELLHNMIVFSMKCKQTTDLENADKLKSLVADFKKAYFAN